MGADILLSMAGGLGLFLFGMTVMSESIEKVAGARLRSILEMFTKNRFTGLIVGIIFTGVIQSSSACTVMVVSFVNSGLMTLYQAAGVIYGANIGTTITSQLVSFNLSEAAPVILLAGVLTMMMGKGKQKVERIGEVIVGFGILFLGLSSMSSAMSGMKDNPNVMTLLKSLHSPLLAILMGTVITAVIQSSSVTVSIVLLMANQGLLALPISLYIILGCNIGACASAVLASLTGKKDAKRAAMIHLLFNIIGTAILYLILLVGIDLAVDLLLEFSGGNYGRFIANAHTIIKIFQVIILFPFSNLIVKLTYLLIPGDDKKVDYRDSFQLKYIGEKVVFNPATAVVEVMNEIERMASLASENLNRAMNALITLDESDMLNMVNTLIRFSIEMYSSGSEEHLEDILHLEDAVDEKERELQRAHVERLTRNECSPEAGMLFSDIVSGLERVADHATNIAFSVLDNDPEEGEAGIRVQKA